MVLLKDLNLIERCLDLESSILSNYGGLLYDKSGKLDGKSALRSRDLLLDCVDVSIAPTNDLVFSVPLECGENLKYGLLPIWVIWSNENGAVFNNFLWCTSSSSYLATLVCLLASMLCLLLSLPHVTFDRFDVLIDTSLEGLEGHFNARPALVYESCSRLLG